MRGSGGEEKVCCECVWVEVEGRSKVVVSVCGWKWKGGARLLLVCVCGSGGEEQDCCKCVWVEVSVSFRKSFVGGGGGGGGGGEP